MIRVYFGNPGCGKTTTMIRNIRKMKQDGNILTCHLKRCKFLSFLFFKKKSKYDYYYTNFDSTITKRCSLDKLGEWTFPENSYLCVDESGIEYNSRKYKSLPQETIAWFKLHRHYCVDVDFVSQSWEDMDVTIRRLADQLWYLRKLGPFTLVRRIYKRVGIDKETHQIIDEYRFGKMITRFIPFPFHKKDWYIVFRPFHYKYFDSYERYYLPLIEE